MADTGEQPTPSTPAARALGVVAVKRIEVLAGAVRRARKVLLCDPDLAAEDVHRLRVASRRALVALDLVDHHAPGAVPTRFRRRISRLRRAAGRVRDGDVQAALLARMLDAANGEQRDEIRALLALLDRTRAESLERLRDRLDRLRIRRLRRPAEKLQRRLDAIGDQECESLATLASRVLASEAERIRAAADANLRDPDRLHEFRLRVKHARDVLDLLRPGITCASGVLDSLREIQERLGTVQDARVLAEHLDVAPLLAARARALHARRMEDTLEWWASQDLGVLLERSLGVAGARALPVEPESRPMTPSAVAPDGPVRLAAIDVGSNSIRLVIAETRGRGRYRVLDDEREMARLATGLDTTGKLAGESITRAVAAVSRMRAIAKGYGVAALRVIATAAVREAGNREELIARLRTEADVDLEVIDQGEEARLAFLSASHAFDLSDLAAGVADIGGGSCQVVLAQRGIVDVVAPTSLGAVRLTEAFGGPEAAAGDRYKDMRRHIREVLESTVPRPFVPQVLIATGGTFTTLGSIVLARQHPGDAPVPVQGTEVDRAQVSHLLDWLRGLSVRARARVPGLPPERADIIVAGLCIAERLLDHLGVNRVLIHDRGIRDGLLIRMIHDLFPSREPVDRLAAARVFAQACRYEERHSEHVARLALALHEQLAASFPGSGAWTSSASRGLLEAAAVLHDVGYLINYDKHHKHGYHLIVNSDLDGFTSREIEVLANIARYHRRSPPSLSHPNFSRLGEEDRELVRRLAGILRLADGLDRTHTQRVAGVGVTVEAGAVRFVLDAPPDSETDRWGAEQKSDLFQDAFGMAPRVELRGGTPPGPSDAGRPEAETIREAT